MYSITSCFLAGRRGISSRTKSKHANLCSCSEYWLFIIEFELCYFPKRTSHEASGFDFEQFGNFHRAFRLGNRAARGEPAAGREIADARDVAGNGREAGGDT